MAVARVVLATREDRVRGFVVDRIRALAREGAAVTAELADLLV